MATYDETEMQFGGLPGEDYNDFPPEDPNPDDYRLNDKPEDVWGEYSGPDPSEYCPPEKFYDASLEEVDASALNDDTSEF